MVKTIISLTDRQMKVLTDHAKGLEISKSELLRRIIDKFLDSDKDLSMKGPADTE